MNSKTHPTMLSDMLISNFGDIVNDIFTENTNNPALTYRPDIEFTEGKTEFKLSLSLPGIAKEDISIKLEDDILKIKGERKRNKIEGKSLVNEIKYGTYNRSLRMPKSVDPNAIKAEHMNGILQITLTKKAETQPRNITIS
ncbi:MAG: Hsp20/alpha crystallin family protein [Bacteroidia bacterium]